ncbi:serpin family protein [Pyxidicoccus fallax]|uniref:Serpin family protein n=1 Tax=Pyxidicoccus fallax TaxID=394095 RepID=A0A848LI44_9BACT|nr:serpin family protein [Pyxidicoccus fallax]NMO17328.1 serpin family protein [Pyxidicoccus fallax]NPC78953.1 serpin family protein [Pyxidicoccus fallax]
MTRSWKDAALALAAVGLLACGETQQAPASAEAPGERVASSLARSTDAAPRADLDAAVLGHTQFALDLYKKVAPPGGDDVFLSPYSISSALSMTYAGAVGETKEAFEQTLNISLAPDAFHRAMNHLDRELGRHEELTSTQQLFVQTGLGMETPFLDVMAREYGADVRLLDFAREHERSRQEINRWVDTRTEHRIPELLSEQDIDASVRVVLVNALSFKASWKQAFDEKLTADRPFHGADGTQTLVRTLRSPEMELRAARLNGVDVVELPYDGDALSMVILAPPAGQLAAFEASLDADLLANAIASLSDDKVSLSMPAFEIRGNANLDRPLQELGLAKAYGDADFSAMTKEAALQIKTVVHQAFIHVDEKGTEAQAATAVVLGERAASSELNLDRPFVFLIRDRATGAILFLGRLVTP